MATALLSLADVALTFGGTPLLTGAELSVAAGDKVVLVGRNGSGKSTLLKIAAGLIEPDRGERFVQPGILVRYLAQETDLSRFATTLEAVEAGLPPTGSRHRANRLLAGLGLSGDEVPAQLSGGEARRVAIAQSLVADPDVLLLDEPTNHLDLPAIEWLEGVLAQSRSAIVLISHDRRFLENLSRRTVWLDRGVTRQLNQGFAAFEDWRDGELASEEAEWHKLDRKIAREQNWMHGGVTGRRKRNVRRVAELATMRQTRSERRRVEGKVEMAAAGAEASGRLIIETTGISKTFAERPIVTDLSLRVLRGDRIGIVGPNGAGKTTLLSLLTGRLEPDSGTVRLGSGIEMVTLDQQRSSLAPDMTVRDALTGGRGDSLVINGHTRHVVSYMKDFLFAAEQARTPLKALSGGERGRVMLARALSQPSNLLVLDEPTNDLDLETLDLLQELLSDYPGTLLLVSHDRDFLDRVVSTVVAGEGGGSWIEYAGGYSDMLAQRGGRELASTQRRTATRTTAKPSEVAAAPPMRPAADTAPPAARTRKLSFKEKHLLQTLPQTVDALTTAIKRLEARLVEPGLYGRDRTGFEATTRELADTEAKLAAAEDEWLRLEMMREELGG